MSNKLTFDLLTLKLVSDSCVTWATSVPILSSRPLCSRVRPDVRDRQTSDVRQTDVRHKHRLMPPPYGGGGIIRRSLYLSVSLKAWSHPFGSGLYVNDSNCFEKLDKCLADVCFRTKCSISGLNEIQYLTQIGASPSASQLCLQTVLIERLSYVLRLVHG